MDVFYASTLYPPAIGGAQIHLHCLAKQVQSLGHSVKVITSAARNRTDWLALSTYRPEPRRDYVHEGIDVSQLGFPFSSRLRMLPAALAYYGLIGPATRRLSKIIGWHIPWPAEDPAVVHVSRIGREFLARAAIDYAHRRGIPFILTPNHHPRWHGYLYREYDRIYGESDAIIALTEAEKQNLVETKGIAPERVHVTGIGPVLADEYSAEAFRERIKWDGPFVLFLGQQLRYKGIGALVEAAPHIFRKHPDIRIVFIGPMSKYSKSIFNGQTDKRLINLGSVDLETKTSALAACELLCLPSMQESFGGVFVEGWAHRKPVIGGRIPPIAAVIDEGVNGLLTTQEPEELAEQINHLLSNDALRRQMGELGYRKVCEKYSWEQISRKTIGVYETLVSAKAVDKEQTPPIEIKSDRRLMPPARAGSSSRGPLKVLVTHNYYKQLGGEDLSFADEANLLESRGHTVVRYTLHNDSIDGMSSLEASKRAVWNSDAYRAMTDLIVRERPDVLHCTNTFPLISPAVYYAARKQGVPVVQSLRNYRALCLNATLLRDGKVCEDCLGKSFAWPGVAHGCYRESRPASAVVATMSAVHWGMGTWTRAVDLFYTLTEFSRQKFIQGGLPANKIALKQNFVNPDPGVGAGDGDYAVFAGRFAAEKGIETLLAAWSLMPGAPKLKIIGDGPQANLVREAALSNPRIEWLGHRRVSEVLSIIGGATCLVIPSIWYETFGRTIIEAFAKGTPVIASRLGAMAELVDDGRTGLHFEAGNPRDLANKVMQLRSDSLALQAMRRAAREEYESRYTPETNYRLLMAIYDRAMQTSAASQPMDDPELALAR